MHLFMTFDELYTLQLIAKLSF